MSSSLLRSQRRFRRQDRSPFSSPFNSFPGAAGRDDNPRRIGAVHHEDEAADSDEGYNEGDGAEEERNGHENDEDEDEDDDATPLLPIFSAAHLDRLPIYNITHSVRLLIIQKCETTLSWDQLRSPQVSQFLVKPIQQQIQSSHFSRATLYALIANCLQFQREGQVNPGNVGVSRTRGMLAELLAMRLLKEYSTRELIDALSYDFDPLQGLTPSGSTTPGPNADQQRARAQARGARISTVEIAIRANAKKFLAHPLVVQQLSAIWAGSIVFHSAADSLHRRPIKPRVSNARSYGAIENPSPTRLQSSNAPRSKQRSPYESIETTTRRSVTLYDPRDASLFKLSRLRVPRYRQIFSTLSFAVMLGLFLAVLIDRSLDITPLEVIFWFWSAGFMLDEIVGFTEQGFGLYIMSVWNAFDLGILLLFVIYYVLRLYGILMPDVRKHHVANMAYDVLASTAVLLFPRLFSVLDHYRYFSQLLIAFRMMAVDLVAILILIIISCSGFFVAFTLSFGDDDFNANGVAYALFQMLMGFTPAAWDIWGGYNMLGKSILTLFLFICHFLIVTILITVLTNSFMAVVQNANEEHQFLFAVNTISMVKSDALFSYIAPTNVLGWLFTPLRYFMPFRQFVRLNRTVIKVTHFPVLFTVFVYERVILSHIAYEPTDLVERRGRSTGRLPGFSQGAAMDLFSPGRRLREPSVTTFHKDRALEEVFRRPFRDATVRLASQNIESDRGKSTTVVDHWMQEMGHEGGASPPMEQPRSVVERLEQRRPSLRRFASVNTPRMGKRDFFGVRSALSDPEDLAFAASSRPQPIQEEPGHFNADDDLLQETDADGDDELVTNDEADRVTITPVSPRKDSDAGDGANDKATRGTDDSDNATDSSRNEVNTKGSPQLASSVPSATRARLFGASNHTMSSEPHRNKRTEHIRNFSTNTVLFSPLLEQPRNQSSSLSSSPRNHSRSLTARHADSAGVGSGTATPAANMSGRRTPKRTIPGTSASRARPVMPPRHLNQSVPNLAGFLALDRGNRRKPSFNAIALDLASDLGDNRHGPDPTTFGGMNGMAASFNTQMAYATGAFGGRRQQHYARESQTRTADDDAGMMSRIMLARMNTLEEGFRDIVKEVKEWRKDSNQGSRPQSEMADVNPSLRQRDSEREWERERERPRKPRKLERRGTRGRGGASLGKESRDAERENRSDRPLTPVTSGLSRVQDSSSPQDSPEAAREDSP